MGEQEENRMKPVIIAVAITGSVPRKKDNPAVPVTPSEQIESTHEAFEAGASLVHVHVRNPDESPSSNPALFAQVQEGVRKHCPGMIIQFSTGGRGRDASARGSALHLKPDMASLATGSVNFPTIIYENSVTFVEELAAQMKTRGVLPEIEVFDLSHIYGARKLFDLGLINDRPHVQFVMGIKNALPAEARILDFLHAELQRALPKATWTAAGIGRHQSEVMEWVLARGGTALRTGLEDNIRVAKDRLVQSNAELVEMSAAACDRHGRRPATPAEARTMLGLANMTVGKNGTQRPRSDPPEGGGSGAVHRRGSTFLVASARRVLGHDGRRTRDLEQTPLRNNRGDR
jgi:3-oxoadipate:acetyl-CoA acetyltransferase